MARETLAIHLFTNPCVINRFIFGQGIVIYYVRKRINDIQTNRQEHSRVDLAHAKITYRLNLSTLFMQGIDFEVQIGPGAPLQGFL